MTLKELNVGDSFRVVGEPSIWRKWPRNVEMIKTNIAGYYSGAMIQPHTFFRGKEVEVVERVGEICRIEKRLILRGGEVVLALLDVLAVHSCTRGTPHTEFVFTGSSFSKSKAKWPSATTALHFLIIHGHHALNRPANTDLLTYDGRVYGRASRSEMLGNSSRAGYKLVRKIDGLKRMVLFGVDAIPNAFPLYDIIMEHFGPDTAK